MLAAYNVKAHPSKILLTMPLEQQGTHSHCLARSNNIRSIAILTKSMRIHVAKTASLVESPTLTRHNR